MLRSKGIVPLVASLGIMAAATAVLWHLKVTTASSDRLVYFYLLPVALVAVLYGGRLAVLSAAMAIFGADYFLQEPIYSLANDNPLEYGDLVCFAILAALAIKSIRVLIRPKAIVFSERMASRLPR